MTSWVSQKNPQPLQQPGTSRDFLYCNKTHKNVFRIRTKPSKLSQLQSFLPRCTHCEVFELDRTVLWASGSKHATPRCTEPGPRTLGDHLGSLILQRTDSPSTHQMLVKVRCGPELTPDNPTVSFQTPGKKTGQETQLLRDLIIQPENTRMRSVAKECCSDLRLANNSE